MSIIINSNLEGITGSYTTEADEIIKKHGGKYKRGYEIVTSDKNHNLIIEEIKNKGTILHEHKIKRGIYLTEIINLSGFNMKSKLYKNLEKELTELSEKVK